MSETAVQQIQIQNFDHPLECHEFADIDKSSESNPHLAKSYDYEATVETFTNPLAEEDLELEEAQEEEQEDLFEPALVTLVVDPDLELKVRRACERISENVHICANEPSLAFFRLSEHVRKALPPTVDSRQQVQTIQRQLGAAYEDADVALQEVQSMEQAAPLLNSTMELLRSSISHQQQLKQEQSKRSIDCSRSGQRPTNTSRSRRPPSFSLARLVS